jgi:hypothetical protein
MHDKVAGQEFYRHDPSDDVSTTFIISHSMAKKNGASSLRGLCFDKVDQPHPFVPLFSNSFLCKRV